MPSGGSRAPARHGCSRSYIVLVCVPAAEEEPMPTSQRSLGRSFIILAAVVVVLAGMYAARSFLSLLLISVFFALLCNPLYLKLLGRGLSRGLALTIIACGIVVVLGFLGLLIWWSVSGLLANLDTYAEQFRQQTARLSGSLAGATDLV